MSTFDAIVIGCGGVGSAAVHALAERGVKVLGLDRFEVAHDRGSSHGQTRAIRMAYFEHPSYVPLLRRSYELWDALAERSGEALFHRTGLVQVGPRDGEVVDGVLASAKAHGLPVELFTAREASREFPQFRFPEELAVVHERNGGYLRVEDCIRAHHTLAREAGAEFRVEAVKSWSAGPSGVEVETSDGRYSAGHLIVTAGPWLSSVALSLGVELTVLRKPLFWLGPANSGWSDASQPVFLFELPEGIFYGFPSLDAQGVKCAEHTGGTEVVDPLQLDREQRAPEAERLRAFARNHLVDVEPSITGHAVCMYTTTPDGHFILDRHPEHDRVLVCGGLSGHGFKMTSVLGESLAEWVADGETRHPIDFLSLDRFR